MDTKLLKRFSALYGQLDIDKIFLESQAGIAKRFLLDEEKKLENFLDIIDHLQALPVAYSEVIKVLCIAATLPVTTASNERLFSRLEIVKNYRDFVCNSQHANEGYFHRRIVYLDKKISRWGTPTCSLVEFSTFSLIT